jgi:hypothetical protein
MPETGDSTEQGAGDSRREPLVPVAVQKFRGGTWGRGFSPRDPR